VPASDDSAAPSSVAGPPARSRQVATLGRRWTYRHALVTRVTHWINVVCLSVLLMSGLQIFNAHPELYWGNASDFEHPTLSIGAVQGGDGQARGMTMLFGQRLDTTGVLGVSRDAAGRALTRAFPAWATLPSWQPLAECRQWHFFFAWLFVLNTLAYLVYGAFAGHIGRDLFPTRQDLRHFFASAWEHVRFQFPQGEEARRYNVLQKLAYLVVVFILFPVIVLAGLAMSPRLDAGFPLLVDLFGGRQSARTIHFIAAWALVAFVLVHVFMVLVSGAWNNIRSMLTGRFAIRVAETPLDERLR
jgi:thiosulfate reductase cytochrome b subunit